MNAHNTLTNLTNAAFTTLLLNTKPNANPTTADQVSLITSWMDSFPEAASTLKTLLAANVFAPATDEQDERVSDGFVQSLQRFVEVHGSKARNAPGGVQSQATNEHTDPRAVGQPEKRDHGATKERSEIIETASTASERLAIMLEKLNAEDETPT